MLPVEVDGLVVGRKYIVVVVFINGYTDAVDLGKIIDEPLQIVEPSGVVMVFPACEEFIFPLEDCLKGVVPEVDRVLHDLFRGGIL
jgi:hypothetical protein